MRRYFLYFALMPGLLLPASLSALAAPSRLSKTHAAKQPRHSVASEHRAVRQSSVKRANRKVAHLEPSQPVATAMIDPVPRGRFPFPPPLKGSHDSLLRQNVRSQLDGLARVQDDADLLQLRRDKQLVAVPVSSALLIDERLAANRRYCRAWTAQFLADLSRVHYARFHRALQVNSAVRTVEYQRHLELVNGNAAPAEGEDASPHLTGATIDIAKKGLSMSEIGWMRAYLMPLQAAGKIDVEEEFYQSCFHITVYRAYRPQPGPDAEEMQTKSGTGRKAALLAAGVR